jgi:predicted short-subunit dehydrogenase-like oxidoreductase (DUF2520 family)
MGVDDAPARPAIPPTEEGPLVHPMRELEREPTTISAIPRGGPPPELGSLAIVGPGRVGRAIAAAAERAGLDATLAGREDAREAIAGAQTVVLCVPDTEIRAAAEVAMSVVPGPELVGHVSGATGLDALEAATSAGAGAFSLHPLQTVPAAGADFTEIPAAVSGSTPAALEAACMLAQRLGMRPFEVAEEHRAAYHAAAAIASNFLVSLQESAVALLAAAGIEDGRSLLAPLVLSTAANWSELGPEALTGPIARGDEETVARHLEALRERAPELVGLYEELAERTRQLAQEAPR